MTNKYAINKQSFDIWTNQKGYPCVTVNYDGKGRAVLLHRLVYETEIGPIPSGWDIHHVDGNKPNWTPANLKAMDRDAHRELHRQARSTKKDTKAGADKVENLNPKRPENNP